MYLFTRIEYHRAINGKFVKQRGAFYITLLGRFNMKMLNVWKSPPFTHIYSLHFESTFFFSFLKCLIEEYNGLLPFGLKDC